MRGKNHFRSIARMLLGLSSDNECGWSDADFEAAMIKADYWGSSITSDTQLVKMLCDMMTDKDGYDGQAFTRFYADCMAKGVPLIWEDLI